MTRVWAILWKEWLELRQQRLLIVTLIFLPSVLTVLPLAVAFLVNQLPPSRSLVMPSAALVNPAAASLDPRGAIQVLLAQQFSVLFLLMPVIIPAVIAAHAIVGEKVGRTLEPILATPVRTWELLLGKGLTALIPAVGITWVAALIFIAGLNVVAVSPGVVRAVASPAWLIVLVGCAPLLAVIAVAIITMVSARVNDPRTAQQVASVAVVPILGLFIGNITGLVMLDIGTAIASAVGLAPLAALAAWLAIRVFQRETILTRWH